MIHAVLFDLDGTLTNTLQDISDAMNHALAVFGLPVHPTLEYRYLVGDGARKLAERAVGERQDLVPQVLACYQQRYEQHSLDKTRPYEGTLETLLALRRRGVPACVLSNKPDADTRRVVYHFFPQECFALVEGQIPGIPVKPDPAHALAMADKMGIPPEQFLYVGDTSVDMCCAKAAGMHPIGALWGFRDEEELRLSGAERIIQAPEELLALL